MVGAFAGLKWRLVTSRIRSAKGATKAWMIVGWCVATIVLVSATFGLINLRGQPDVARITVTTLFTSQFLAWALAPLVAFGIDETIDPAKFALLPLRPATLQTGLLVSSLIGYLPLANAVVLVGAAIALSTTWGLLPVALVCCAAQLLICVGMSRALSTAMSGLMSGRRGRDLGVMAGFGMFVLYMGLTLGLRDQGNAADQGSTTGLGGGFKTLSSILGWGPPGSLAQLPGLAADGHWLRVIIAIATVVIGAVLLWWWWSFALRRSLTTISSTTQGPAPAGVSKSHAVADSVWGTARLVAGRDRLLAWRDPMRRVSWLTVAFLGSVYPFIVVKGHGSVFAVILPALLVGTLSANIYGMEGSGVWLHLVSFADASRARGEVLGHALVAVVPGSGIVVIATIIQATVRHDWDLFPAALGVCLAAMLGGAAFGGYLSARIPYAMRQSRKSMFANTIAGQKGRTTGANFGLLGGGLLVALPAIGLAVLSVLVSHTWGWAALIAGPVVGAIVLWWMSGITARSYLGRGPEILQIVAMGDRG